MLFSNCFHNDLWTDPQVHMKFAIWDKARVSLSKLLSTQTCNFLYDFQNFFASNQSLLCDLPSIWLVWFMAYVSLIHTFLLLKSLWKKW